MILLLFCKMDQKGIFFTVFFSFNNSNYLVVLVKDKTILSIFKTQCKMMEITRDVGNMWTH